jgi:protoporphyrinogen oxidase
MRDPRALILGAGPAGLTAAVVLRRAGWPVQVVEKAPAVGGLTRTIERMGFRFDLGGHRFYTKKREVHEFVAALLGDDFLTVPRLSRIHFRGRFVDYPIRPVNALRNVGLGTSLRIAADLLRLSVRPRKHAPRSLADWMETNYGRTLFETYFKVYAEKVWGMPADRIHPDLAAQRVKGLNLLQTLRHAVFPKSAVAVESIVERFHYPRFGYGQICAAMAQELARDAAVSLETTPVRIAHDGRRVRGVVVAGPDGSRCTIAPEQVVSSIPITALLRALDPAPPAAVQQAVDELGYRAVVFVAAFLDVPSVRPESWIYFPSPDISFGRITEPRNWSAALSPAGQTSIVAEHFCDPGDRVYGMPDDEIVRLTVRDLSEKLGFFAPEQVLGACVVRAPAAYPRMSVDHKRPLQVIEGYLDGFANLQTVGRGGLYRYHNTDHVIETAFAAATNILGGRADVRAVNSELVYHEERRTA